MADTTQIALESERGERVSLQRLFLTCLFVLLTGYATMNKGFAYIGIPPLFVGEIVLLLGLLATLDARNIALILSDRVMVSVGLFMLWGAARTIPFLATTPFFALRDSVIWSYGLYAFCIVSALLSDRKSPIRLLTFFQNFATAFIYLFPICFFLTEIAGDSIPSWPDSNISIIELKIPDALVHISGIVALLMAGIVRSSSPAKVVLMCGVLIGAARARSGFVAFVGAILLIGSLAPVKRYLGIGFAIVMLAFGALWVSDLHIKLTNARELSAQSITKGLEAITAINTMGNWRNGETVMREAGRLNGTVIWRAIWAGFLVEKTQREAPLAGFGFGRSLNMPGLPLVVQRTTRSPHNGFVTIFARMGLVGLALWFGMLGVWFHAMISSNLRALRSGQFVWASIFMALPAYVLAALINACFDVSLEGPMIGIWFWSLIGMGAGLRRWYLADPDYWSGSAIPPTEST